MSEGIRGDSIQVMSAQVGGYLETQSWNGSQLEQDEFMEILIFKEVLKASIAPWPGSSVGQSIAAIHQGCRFDPWSGHMQESVDESMHK